MYVCSCERERESIRAQPEGSEFRARYERDKWVCCGMWGKSGSSSSSDLELMSSNKPSPKNSHSTTLLVIIPSNSFHYDPIGNQLKHLCSSFFKFAICCFAKDARKSKNSLDLLAVISCCGDQRWTSLNAVLNLLCLLQVTGPSLFIIIFPGWRGT